MELQGTRSTSVDPDRSQLEADRSVVGSIDFPDPDDEFWSDFNFEDFATGNDPNQSLESNDSLRYQSSESQTISRDPQSSSASIAPSLLADIHGNYSDSEALTPAIASFPAYGQSIGPFPQLDHALAIESLNKIPIGDSSAQLRSTPQTRGHPAPYIASPATQQVRESHQVSPLHHSWNTPGLQPGGFQYVPGRSSAYQSNTLHGGQPHTALIRPRHVGLLTESEFAGRSRQRGERAFDAVHQPALPRNQYGLGLTAPGLMLGPGGLGNTQDLPPLHESGRTSIVHGAKAIPSQSIPTPIAAVLGQARQSTYPKAGSQSKQYQRSGGANVYGLDSSSRENETHWTSQFDRSADDAAQYGRLFNGLANLGNGSDVQRPGLVGDAPQNTLGTVIDHFDRSPRGLHDHGAINVTSSRSGGGAIPPPSTKRLNQGESRTRPSRLPRVSNRRVNPDKPAKCIECRHKAHPDHRPRCKRCYEKFLRHTAEPPIFTLDDSVPDLTTAVRVIYPPMAAISPVDDDVASEKIKEEEYIQRLLDAICTPVSTEREWHGEDEYVIEWHINQQSIFNGRAVMDSEDAYDRANITARLRLLFKAVVDLHEGSVVSIYPAGGDSKGYKVDAGLTFSQRMAEMQDYLKDCKTIAMNIIEGKGTLGFVGNPRAYYARILSNMETNRVKKQGRKSLSGPEVVASENSSCGGDGEDILAETLSGPSRLTSSAMYTGRDVAEIGPGQTGKRKRATAHAQDVWNEDTPASQVKRRSNRISQAGGAATGEGVSGGQGKGKAVDARNPIGF